MILPLIDLSSCLHDLFPRPEPLLEHVQVVQFLRQLCDLLRFPCQSVNFLARLVLSEFS